MANDPKDGFDLIEYPTEFAFKAMCRAEVGLNSQDYIKDLVSPIVEESAVICVSGNTSKTGKFESVTLTVRLESRHELESIYQVISSSSKVVMTL